jgi:hypothetical protein
MNEDMGLLNDAMTEPTHESSPFISKQTVIVTDNNPNASYVSSQIVFSTDSLSGNGLYADMRNAVIEILMVFIVEAITANKTCDFTADATVDVLGQKGLDAILSTKCSDLAFINTMSVELDGGSVVSVTDNIASYLIWRKHDSQGPYSRDELYNYVRDGINWSIAADGSLRNCSSRREVDTLTQPFAAGANEGMYHRSHNAFTSATNASVAAVFDDFCISPKAIPIRWRLFQNIRYIITPLTSSILWLNASCTLFECENNPERQSMRLYFRQKMVTCYRFNPTVSLFLDQEE